jgi:DNA-binding transcriptional MerR regulator
MVAASYHKFILRFMFTRTYVAKAIDVHPNTIARWEVRGVVEPPARDNAGRRIYTSADLTRLRQFAATRRPEPPKDRT